MNNLWFPLFILACSDSEEGLKIYNSDPMATITSHVDGAELLESVEYTFVGIVADDNHSTTDLRVKWSTDTRELCAETYPDADGSTSCRVGLEPSDTQLKLQVLDPEDSATLSSISINVQETEAPGIELLSPRTDGVYYSDQLIQFSARISDAEDDVYDLIYEWSSSLEGALPFTVGPDSDGSIEAFMMLSPGQHAISLNVEDTTGKSKTESVVIQVGGPNQEPLCEITEPSPSSTYNLGQNVTFLGTVTDPDINNSLLDIQWISDQDGIFNTTAANTSGELSFITNTLSVGNHTITLQVEDEIGGLCTDTLLLSLGTPPTLEVDEPINSSIFSLNEAITFTATVSDTEELPSDISLSWNSHIDGEFSTQGSDSNGNIYFSFSDLSAGIHNILVYATDSSGLSSSASLSLQINTPPSAPSIEISPEPAYTSDDLYITLTEAADPDGDAITYAYQWYQNGSATAYTSQTVPSSAISSNEVWKIRVTPNDGYIDGNYAEENITISNSEPTVDSISISPTTAYNDSTLTCLATANDDDQSLSVDYSWFSGSNALGNGATLDLSTLTILPTANITCMASVEDDAGASASMQTDRMLENRDPSVSAVQISPTTIYNDDLVSCSATVVDDDGELPTHSTSWSVGGVIIGTGDSIQLDSNTISVGETLICTFEASDSYAATDSDTTSIVISNRSPLIENISLLPNEPSKNDTVLCSASTQDPDFDTTTLTFEWSNGTTGDIYAATSTTTSSSSLDLSTTSALVSDTILCSMTATDIHGSSSNSTQTVTVMNSAPEFDATAEISPNTGVYTNTQLTCTATATDPNDGSITPVFAWSVNGSPLYTGNSYTILAADTDVGDIITCTATATDSDLQSTSSSVAVTIENTEPVLSGTLITPSSGIYNDGSISCTASVADPDETLVITYSWQLASNIIGTSSSINLSTTSALPDDSILCISNVLDTSGASDSESTSITVENRAPSAPVISISPSDPMEGVDDLVCTIDTPSIDPDGETVTYIYVWLLNGSQTTETSSTVSSSDIIQGEEWTCLVTPTDGSVLGTDTSDSVVISGDALANCNEILDAGLSIGDGVYEIDPDGTGSFDAYCDMTTDGGGWTLLLNRNVLSDDLGQGNLDNANGFFNNSRNSNWWFDVNQFWPDASEVVFAAKQNNDCSDCSIMGYDSAIKVPRPSGSMWENTCTTTTATAYAATKLVGSGVGSTTGYMCENTLGWGNCSGKLCHYGTHWKNESNDGSWSQNYTAEMHFPSVYSSYADYGTYSGAEGNAYCRSCAGGLAGIYNNSSTCCKNSTYNAKARWTIWMR
jgi:hypothetical protein